MTSTQLTPLVFGALSVFIVAAAIAIYGVLKERNPPRALLEISAEKVLSAAFVATYAVIFWNTDHDYPLFDPETAKVIARLAPILFIAKPVLFILAYAFNWFRDPAPREAGRRLSR